MISPSDRAAHEEAFAQRSFVVGPYAAEHILLALFAQAHSVISSANPATPSLEAQSLSSRRGFRRLADAANIARVARPDDESVRAAHFVLFKLRRLMDRLGRAARGDLSPAIAVSDLLAAAITLGRGAVWLDLADAGKFRDLEAIIAQRRSNRAASIKGTDKTRDPKRVEFAKAHWASNPTLKAYAVAKAYCAKHPDDDPKSVARSICGYAPETSPTFITKGAREGRARLGLADDLGAF